jgi:Tfp pilus assembly protein PilF
MLWLTSAFLLAFTLTNAVSPNARPANLAEAKLPITGLKPAKIIPNLCRIHYSVTTHSPECQQFFDQGLGYLYSYVYMEAARSFETATQKDPECALAWWGLSRALESWHRIRYPEMLLSQLGEPFAVLALNFWNSGTHLQALRKAQELLPRASHREQLLITARAQENGLVAELQGDARRRAACKTVDELLALYDDDEEGWFCRAQLAVATETEPKGGPTAYAGMVVAAVPYYRALLRYNPLHPGANHELLHFYEIFERPALGWVHAENYLQSSPGIPHAFHMQAHLATRLGRWDKTSDRSARAIELERAYHREMHVNPKDDSQYPHHLDVLLLSLTHDGRFREARAIERELHQYGAFTWMPCARLHLAARDWDAALQFVDKFRRSNKLTASYLAALVYLKQGDPRRAAGEVEVLRQAYSERKDDRQLESQLWEVQGLLLCQTGSVGSGLKLLAKAAERSKSDYWRHSWGGGAYFLETWGIAALQAGEEPIAEEALLEALAHDPASVVAALGLQRLCERQGRGDEAGRYADLARRCWRRADPGALAVLRETVFTNGNAELEGAGQHNETSTAPRK